MGSIQRFFDIFSRGTGKLANDRAIDRRGIGEILAFDRRYEFAADVIAVTGLQGDQSTLAARGCITHGGSPDVVFVMRTGNT